MKTDAEVVRELLAEHDPAKDVHGDLRERRLLMETILAGSPPARAAKRRKGLVPRLTRRRVVLTMATAAAGLAVIAADLLVSVNDRSVALATTPLPLATGKPVYGAKVDAVLRDLAAKAERQPDTIGRGPVVYTKTSNWYLHTTVADRRTSAAVVPTTEEQWIRPDGSGRQVSQAGQPWFPTERSRQEWVKQGKPEWGAENQDDRYGPGELSLQPNADALPVDPAALRRVVSSRGEIRGTLAMLETIVDLHRQQPIRPRVQGALLRLLADDDELGYAGTVKDRAGRPGAAFILEHSQHGLPSRDVVIFDRRTGALLSTEEVLIKDPGKLPVQIPAVTDYTLFLKAARVDDVDRRP
ncbi:CU044_5270 family protein [Actinomadura sp. 6N118]|uniref:CU044_5270 family protein n=1 Tax=Actinomadura sp. 6N118 TaxID=3375151 RepID=UPI0037A03A90